ncbi:MAG: nitric oxide reductase transcriptional regulator NorR [Pseudomonadales bacterium]|nr:nitric oxide reductase transcriptional regulator NorR [Pseudomonadales bacterium]
MTTSGPLASLSDIVADLSRELPPKARFQRLLEALMNSFPCDATALLQLDGEVLVPRAAKGLSPDTMGRRFELTQQPRLQEIVHSRGLVRFPADSPLPDPYDGLVDTPNHHLYVHDCMGAPLQVDGRTWGVLTLDALEEKRFDDIDMNLLETFVSVAAASIRAAELITTLESNLERHQLVQQSWLTEHGQAELTGESECMQRLILEAKVVGNSELPVLIQGETGVGKELVAHLIHMNSPRATQPMVHVNCAALPESIAESELFGHVSGAFSGANKDRAGKFELAHSGTLFLDEVGELPLSIQAKLLRALQSGEIQRVGSDALHHADVRIIAATNRELDKEVKAGRFRADLYHRLSVYPVQVPPLRNRGSDIPLLAGHFLQNCERKFGLRGLRLNSEANRWLKTYTWPGNVRELENAISRAVVKALSEGYPRNRIIELSPAHLGADPIRSQIYAGTQDAAEAHPQLSLAAAVEQFKRDLIQARLQQHDNNLSSTAVSLGMDKSNLHRQVRKLGLR